MTKKNRFSFGVANSLTIRVLLISLVLLVLPLLIYALVLYRQEYRIKVQDVVTSLNILAKSTAAQIEENVKDQQNFLNVIAYHIQKKDLSFSQMSHTFKVLKAQSDISQIFYLEDVDHHLRCRASSSTCPFNEDFSKLRYGLQRKNFSYLSYNYDLEEMIFYVGRPLYQSDQKNAKGLLLFATPAEEMLKKLSYLENFSYPVDLSIVAPNDLILASSNKRLTSKKLEDLSFKKINKEGYETNQKFAVIQKIKGTDLSLLLDVSKKWVQKTQIQSTFFRMIVLLFVILIVGGILTLFLTFRVARPLKKLFSVMEKREKGNRKIRYEKDKMGFEINLLGNQLNEMIDAMEKHQKKEQKERIEKEVYLRELKTGHEIQKSILQKKILTYPSLDLFFKYIPAKEVSGDFYDVFLVKNQLLIVIADTAGKGVPACLYSMGLRTLLRSFCSSYDLKEAILKTNELYCMDTEEASMFTTAWIGLFDLKTHVLTYCNQGHHPALLRQKEKILPLDTKGMALGVKKFKKLKVEKVQLQPEDLLLLYTDGLVDARNRKKELFSDKRIYEFIKKSKDKTAQKTAENLYQKAKTFAGKKPFDDDITILTLQVQ